MSQGYWSLPTPWGDPPGGQAPPPFGSPLWRTLLLWPMTSIPPTVRQAYVKIGFVCLLDYFTFLTRSFISLSGRLGITTKRQTRIRLRQQPLQPSERIRRQRCGIVVLVSFVFEIVLSCQTSFAFACCELYCLAAMYDMLYILPVLEAPRMGGNQNRQ
jgi:hypothetical protein